MTKYLEPNWPAPKRVKAYSTTRQGGFSQGPYTSFNLGKRVTDDPEIVEKNRQKLQADLQLPTKPAWIRQTHSAIVLSAAATDENTEADATYTTTPNKICAVLTADCLPILLCNRAGTAVAAIHGGWRGLAGGIIANTIQAMAIEPAELLAWLGPAIGPEKFEVGKDVLDAFLMKDPDYLTGFKAIENTDQPKWLANIYILARQSLAKCGVQNIYGGEHCTYTENDLFFSHRRDKQTGRMASLIWLEDSGSR